MLPGEGGGPVCPCGSTAVYRWQCGRSGSTTSSARMACHPIYSGAGSLKPGSRKQFINFNSIISLVQGGRRASFLCSVAISIRQWIAFLSFGLVVLGVVSCFQNPGLRPPAPCKQPLPDNQPSQVGGLGSRRTGSPIVAAGTAWLCRGSRKLATAMAQSGWLISVQQDNKSITHTPTSSNQLKIRRPATRTNYLVIGISA